MTASLRSLRARLAALQAASFVSQGIYLPFFPVWLQTHALNPAMIGIAVAVPIVVRIVATAPLLSLADRAVGPRLLLLASHLGQIVGFSLLMFDWDAVGIVGLVGFVAIAQAAVTPGNDLVTTAAVQRHPGLNYGRIRVFGSVAFVGTNVAAGYLMGAFGPKALLAALTLVPILAIAATLVAVPGRRPDGSGRPADDGAAPDSLPAVLWIALIAAAMTQGSHGALYAFASISWQAQGFADSIIGYFWAIGVVAEILVFVGLGNAVGRGTGVPLILIGSAAAVVRFAVMSLHPGLAVTLVLQVMHSLTFGASHLGAMAALTALAPPRARGRAQGIYGSLTALFTAAATVVSGLIYRQAGAAAFAAMVPLGAVGFALALVAARTRVQPQRAGSGG